MIYLVRWQQGGWELTVDLFKDQREAMDAIITNLLPSPQAQLLSGIVLGEKKDLPTGLRLALRDTSTLHIVVVSGQNLSMVAGFFLALSGLIKRRLAISLSFLAIIFYTLLTGADVPVVRAAIMVSLAFLAQIMGREHDGLRVLTITAALMLLINPRWLLDLSFQLSFMATLGLVVISPILLKFLRSLPLIGQDLAITLGAQLMVIPIIAQNFHQLSIVGIFANLAVGWTVPIIMVLGLITIMAGLIGTGLGQVMGFFANIFLTYFIYIVQFFASLPFAWEYVGEKIWVVWVGYYLVLGGFLIAINRKK
ncbi:ComEC/Rec2 family competence protein [Candidatus Daviesbacteria bacterium]|nr:ComEC/Rec2 family competence protein [Candidatus Daviesbacteria bacterium]